MWALLRTCLSRTLSLCKGNPEFLDFLSNPGILIGFTFVLNPGSNRGDGEGRFSSLYPYIYFRFYSITLYPFSLLSRIFLSIISFLRTRGFSRKLDFFNYPEVELSMCQPWNFLFRINYHYPNLIFETQRQFCDQRFKKAWGTEFWENLTLFRYLNTPTTTEPIEAKI